MGDPRTSTEIESHPEPTSAAGSAEPKLFTTPAAEPSHRGKVIGVGIVAILLAFVTAVVFERESKARPTGAQNVVLPADAYAPSLVFTQLAMSESTSLSGGKSTFIDGHVKNAGGSTLTGVTMQVRFRNDVGLSPQVEVLPLNLIRTHEPYVDTEPVSAAPLKPGDEVEFRLIFETVNANWNQQMPELVVIHVAKR